LSRGKFIEPPYAVGVFVVNDEGAAPIRETIARFGEEYARGPGIVVRRVVAAEDQISSLFEIEFFQQYKSHASVLVPT